MAKRNRKLSLAKFRMKASKLRKERKLNLAKFKTKARRLKKGKLKSTHDRLFEKQIKRK